jgi:hypothetical protein
VCSAGFARGTRHGNLDGAGASTEVMGKLAVTGAPYWLGWASTIAMGFYIIGTMATMFTGSPF